MKLRNGKNKNKIVIGNITYETIVINIPLLSIDRILKEKLELITIGKVDNCSRVVIIITSKKLFIFLPK